MRPREILAAGVGSALLLLCAVSGVAAPADAGRPEATGELSLFVDAARRNADVQGVAAALLRDGKPAWVGVFGQRDARSGSPVHRETIFEAASLGKVVAAYAALLLVEEGRWSLEMPVRSPRLQAEPGCRPPSLAELLSHAAGLGNDLKAERFTAACRLPAPFDYAGQGYQVLQELLEAEGGGSAELLIRRRIFVPLGMSRSTFGPAAGEDQATGHVDLVYGVLTARARGPALHAAAAGVLTAVGLCVFASLRTWSRRRSRWAVAGIALLWVGTAVLLVGLGAARTVPVEPWSRRVMLASSLKTTVDDLARFSEELLSPKLMRPETRDLLFAPRTEVGGGLGWGAGIGIDRTATPTTYWQWGSNPGFQSLLVLAPERGDAVIVLTNTGGFLDLLSGRRGGYNMSKRVAQRALGIDGRWDLRPPMASGG